MYLPSPLPLRNSQTKAVPAASSTDGLYHLIAFCSKFSVGNSGRHAARSSTTPGCVWGLSSRSGYTLLNPSTAAREGEKLELALQVQAVMSFWKNLYVFLRESWMMQEVKLPPNASGVSLSASLQLPRGGSCPPQVATCSSPSVCVPLFYFNEDKILGTAVSVSNQCWMKSSGQHVTKGKKKRRFITTALLVQQS